jgi:hypothetical protein
MTRCIELKRIGALAVLLSLLCLPLLNLHASVNPISMTEKAIGLSGAQAAGRETTTVIGKFKDLRKLEPEEQSLLSRLPDLGGPKANWAQNAGVLRQEMGRGLPIRDASVNPATGELINYPGSLA